MYLELMSDEDLKMQAWIQLMRRAGSILIAVERNLKTNGFQPLEWYDVLLELERAMPDGVRPFELEKALLLPQYGISRLLNRIEKAGFLRREKLAQDGRGQLLFITEAGKNYRQQVWPIYRDSVYQELGQKLADQEAKNLIQLLRKLA